MAVDTNIFNTINSYASLRGFYGKYSSEALQWYKNEMSQLQVGRMKLLADNQKYQHSKPGIGRFCFFFYSAKGYTDGTLDYYDTSPLSLILSEDSKHFAGLNWHYLRLDLRVRLFQEILKIQGSNFSEQKKLEITYESIKAVTNLYKPCYKQYLKNRVKSQVVWVPMDSAVIATFLPVANFKGATQSEVWSDSDEKMRED